MHIDRGEATIKIWLGNGEVAKSRGFRAHEINEIMRLVKKHRSDLKDAWHEHFNESNG